jgi:lysophospholipase L1-like esterase
MPSILYLAKRDSPTFEAGRTTVDVVCARDSITGWNNFGLVEDWPYRIYPEFLQRLCEPSGSAIANGGIAGEVGANGLGQVEDYLSLFPNARYFVIGYGNNDLGMWPDVEPTSPRIIENLDGRVRAVRDDGRWPLLLNVPYANESMFPRPLAEDLHRMRDYHNERLAAYCRDVQAPLVDPRWSISPRSSVTSTSPSTGTQPPGRSVRPSSSGECRRYFDRYLLTRISRLSMIPAPSGPLRRAGDIPCATPVHRVRRYR